MDPLDEKRNGYSLSDCADILQRHGEIKLEFGELAFAEPWQQFLRSKGLTEATWADVWNDWREVIEADNALAAKFHTYRSQLGVRAMTAGQANVAGEALGGVTLEQYAKINALTAAGKNTDELVAEEGLTMDQWLQGQAAWAEKMGAISPTDPIMLQFGQLFQKYNQNVPTEGGSASMEQIAESVLDKESQIQGDRSVKVTLENAATEFFASPIVRHRARGTREVLNLWDRSGDRDSNPSLRNATQGAYDVCIDLLENGPGSGPGTGPGFDAVTGAVDDLDIHKWSDIYTEEEANVDPIQTVISAFRDLASAEFMSPQQSERSKSAIRAAIQRLEPRKNRTEALFGQASDTLKKTQLRTLLDEYVSLLQELDETVSDWSYQGPESSSAASSASASVGGSPSAASAASSASSGSMTTTSEESPLMAILKRLPIIGQILRALGL